MPPRQFLTRPEKTCRSGTWRPVPVHPGNGYQITSSRTTWREGASPADRVRSPSRATNAKDACAKSASEVLNSPDGPPRRRFGHLQEKHGGRVIRGRSHTPSGSMIRLESARSRSSSTAACCTRASKEEERSRRCPVIAAWFGSPPTSPSGSVNGTTRARVVGQRAPRRSTTPARRTHTHTPGARSSNNAAPPSTTACPTPA